MYIKRGEVYYKRWILISWWESRYFQSSRRRRSWFPSHRRSHKIGYWAVKIHTHTRSLKGKNKKQTQCGWKRIKWGCFILFFFFSYMFHSSYAYTLGKEKRWWYYVCPFFVPFTYCYYILLTTWRARRIGRCTETLFSFSSYFIFIVVYFYDAYSSSQSLAFNAPLFELARKGHLHFPGPVCRLHFFLSREKNPNLHIEKIKKSKINKKNLLFIYSRTFIHLKITVGYYYNFFFLPYWFRFNGFFLLLFFFFRNKFKAEGGNN